VSQPFNAQSGLIIVPGEVAGPAGNFAVRLALDTGATTSAISTPHLIRFGYDPASSGQQRNVMTGGGVVPMPVLTVTRIEALGQVKTAFQVIGMNLPPGAAIHGVIGLDFLRGHVLKIDFRQGEIDLS
jgi:predicted aspartyl protease